MKKNYTVLTMGNFDGVHLGHQKLLKEVVKRAKKNNGHSIVLTYCKHPLETLNIITFPYLLTKTEYKEKLLKKLGIDQIEYLNFDLEMSKLEPSVFLERYIIQKFQADEIVFGYDTHFGKDRKGNFKLLKDKEKKFNYNADLIEPFKIQDEIISSSIIRELIRNGKIQLANKYLSREYSLSGIVKEGKKIGRKLGSPTINISTQEKYKLLPRSGVYLTKLFHLNKIYFSITNIGKAPTLKDLENITVETHIFNFDKKIYGDKVKIEFLEFIRPEKKFSSKEELIKNIQNDIELANNKIRNNYEK